MIPQLSRSPSPRSHAGFQHVGMHRERRQLLADAFGLLLHQVHVLEVLGDAAFGREVAADHLAALDVHDLRIGRRRAHHLEERRGIEPEPLGERQPFRQRQPVEAEDEIDRELGAAAVADLADVEIGREQRAQDRLDFGRGLRIAADQADAFAARHLAARTGDRRFEQTQARAASRARPARRCGRDRRCWRTSTMRCEPSPSAGSNSRSITSSTWSVLNTARMIGAQRARDVGDRRTPAAPPSLASVAVLAGSMS